MQASMQLGTTDNLPLRLREPPRAPLRGAPEESWTLSRHNIFQRQPTPPTEGTSPGTPQRSSRGVLDPFTAQHFSPTTDPSGPPHLPGHPWGDLPRNGGPSHGAPTVSKINSCLTSRFQKKSPPPQAIPLPRLREGNSPRERAARQGKDLQLAKKKALPPRPPLCPGKG